MRIGSTAFGRIGANRSNGIEKEQTARKGLEHSRKKKQNAFERKEQTARKGMGVLRTGTKPLAEEQTVTLRKG